MEGGTQAAGNGIGGRDALDPGRCQNLDGHTAGHHSQKDGQPNDVLKKQQRDGAQNVERHSNGCADAFAHGRKALLRRNLLGQAADDTAIAVRFAVTRGNQAVVLPQGAAQGFFLLGFHTGGAGKQQGHIGFEFLTHTDFFPSCGFLTAI